MEKPEDILCFEMMDTSRMSFFGGGSNNNTDKSKYEHLTLSIKQTVLERARYRCHGCSKKFGPSNHPHFEHINGSLKDNRPANLRPLCSDCFKSVEKKETKKSGLIGNMRNTIGGEYFKNEIFHFMEFGYLDRFNNTIKPIFSGSANLQSLI